MNCNNCIKNCKAECCTVVPFDKEFFFSKKTVREVEYFEDMGDIIIATAKGDICPFLNEDFSCSIYKDRPEICKEFGSDKHLLLSCPYQDKNGRTRSRQERRSIAREQKKRQKQVIDQLRFVKSRKNI